MKWAHLLSQRHAKKMLAASSQLPNSFVTFLVQGFLDYHPVYLRSHPAVRGLDCFDAALARMGHGLTHKV